MPEAFFTEEQLSKLLANLVLGTPNNIFIFKYLKLV